MASNPMTAHGIQEITIPATSNTNFTILNTSQQPSRIYVKDGVVYVCCVIHCNNTCSGSQTICSIPKHLLRNTISGLLWTDYYGAWKPGLVQNDTLFINGGIAGEDYGIQFSYLAGN